MKRKKQIQTPNGNTINWKDFETFYQMINNIMLTVNKNINNILSGEIKKISYINSTISKYKLSKNK